MVVKLPCFVEQEAMSNASSSVPTNDVTPRVDAEGHGR